MQILQHQTRNSRVPINPAVEAWKTIEDIERILTKVSSLKIHPSFTEFPQYASQKLTNLSQLEIGTKSSFSETETVTKTSVTSVPSSTIATSFCPSTSVTATEVPSEETISHEKPSCYVRPVHQGQDKDLSRTCIKTAGRNIQIPFSTSYQEEVKEKLKGRKNLQELSFPYVHRSDEKKLTNDFVVYPLSEGDHIVTKTDFDHKYLKSVQTSMAPDLRAKDFISNISEITGCRSKVPFDKYIKAVDNCLKIKNGSFSTIDADLQSEADADLASRKIYHSYWDRSKSSIFQDISEILTPSEQSIFRRTSDLGEIIEMRNRMLSSSSLYKYFKNDEQVQAQTSMFSIETMTENVHQTTSIQTLISYKTVSPNDVACMKGTQTSVKNVERLIVLLPIEKVLRENVGKTKEELMESRKHEGARRSSIKTSQKPKTQKSVRIDPKFVDNVFPYPEKDFFRDVFESSSFAKKKIGSHKRTKSHDRNK